MTTSYQQVLVHVDASAPSRVRLQIANKIAAQHGAALQATYAATSSAVAMTYPEPVSADLLVMGCYGHSRMREWMLGGTSRTVLRSTTLPVLMAH